MSKHPLVNALSAFAYIALVALVMNFGSKMANHPDSFLAPVAFISLFTLSAAVMGYLFCYQPLQLYFDGKKKAGVQLFLQTVAGFGVLTAVAMVLVLTGAFR